MKKSNLLLTCAAALLLAPITPTFAQTWQTVDELTPWRGRDIVADAAGNFFSLAIDNGATGSTGVVSTAVSMSSDHGATWETVGLIAGYALDLAVAPGDGALFAVGNRSATVSGRAFVWQSLDHGATWTEINPWAGQTGTFLCHDVAAGNTSSIYLCGYLYGGGRWIVRKGDRTASGITWTTVDNIPGNQADSICVRSSTIPGQPDEVLVSGSASGLWTIRRSANGGATWATVDSYAGGGYSGVATGPDNSIYTVARASMSTSVTNWTVVKKKLVPVITATTEGGWLVRKSMNGGASWTNADFFVNGWPGNGPITVDAFGRVFVVGGSNNPGLVGTSWLVRGSTDGGVTWISTDSFLPLGATRGSAYGVAADGLGNVCVMGELFYGTAMSAPIRRLAAP